MNRREGQHAARWCSCQRGPYRRAQEVGKSAAGTTLNNVRVITSGWSIAILALG